jgi:DNA-binding MarR family transcriptional regulator
MVEHVQSNRRSDLASLIRALAVAQRHVSSVVWGVLRDTDARLVQGEFEVLSTLSEAGSLRTSDLSSGFSMAPSTLTRYCDHLAELGFIRRERSRDDRREIRVAATELGRSLVDEVIRRRDDELASRLSGLTGTEWQTFVRVAEQIGSSPPASVRTEQRESA